MLLQVYAINVYVYVCLCLFLFLFLMPLYLGFILQVCFCVFFYSQTIRLNKIHLEQFKKSLSKRFRQFSKSYAHIVTNMDFLLLFIQVKLCMLKLIFLFLSFCFTVFVCVCRYCRLSNINQEMRSTSLCNLCCSQSHRRKRE